MPEAECVDHDFDCFAAALASYVDHNSLPEPSYFTELILLDSWAELRIGDHSDALLYSKRRSEGLLSVLDVEQFLTSGDEHALASEDDSGSAKVMVCHDHKGGYQERPDARCYTFEHWQLADYFVYFSHHRVTCPPPGWIAAAQRHGTRMLGTLIFEWKESVEDLALLLRGPLLEEFPAPWSSLQEEQVTFSPHFADQLITLAMDRGFDGYLINVEVSLDLGKRCDGSRDVRGRTGYEVQQEMFKNARRLRAWIAYLRAEGRRRLVKQKAEGGQTWHVSYYDSIIYPSGELAWQDGLTPSNAPFFEVSDSLFTNYTWVQPPMDPSKLPPGQFPLPDPPLGFFHPALQRSISTLPTLNFPKQRAQIFTGVDIFGRNCYGGHDSYKSLRMIKPLMDDTSAAISSGESPTGLSVALFAPGWTWEHDEPRSSGRGWTDWYNEDTDFWRSVSSHFSKPRPLCVHPAKGFYTSFCKGSGDAWYVKGRKVKSWSHAEGNSIAGWTDMGACMPPPAFLLLPRDWLGPHATIAMTECDAWSGNSSVHLQLQHHVTMKGKKRFIPLASITLAQSALPSGDRAMVKFQFRCGVKMIHGELADIKPSFKFWPGEEASTIRVDSNSHQATGWTILSREVNLDRSKPDATEFGLLVEWPSKPANRFELLIGFLALVPSQSLLDIEAQEVVRPNEQSGLTTWTDSHPMTPFYELFDQETSTWIGTATREWKARTQAVVPTRMAAGSVIVRPLAM